MVGRRSIAPERTARRRETASMAPTTGGPSRARNAREYAQHRRSWQCARSLRRGPEATGSRPRRRPGPRPPPRKSARGASAAVASEERARDGLDAARRVAQGVGTRRSAASGLTSKARTRTSRRHASSSKSGQAGRRGRWRRRRASIRHPPRGRRERARRRRTRRRGPRVRRAPCGVGARGPRGGPSSRRLAASPTAVPSS